VSGKKDDRQMDNIYKYNVHTDGFRHEQDTILPLADMVNYIWFDLGAILKIFSMILPNLFYRKFLCI
jgi:hypothetical protein